MTILHRILCILLGSLIFWGLWAGLGCNEYFIEMLPAPIIDIGYWGIVLVVYTLRVARNLLFNSFEYKGED